MPPIAQSVVSATSWPWRARVALLVALATAPAWAAPALGAPALPRLPADGAAVDTRRPVFAWTAGSSVVPIARYEVLVETGGGPVKVAEAPAGTLSAPSAADLPDDRRHRWFVRIVNRLGGVAATPPADRAEVVVATVPAAPALAAPVPGGPTTFAWTGDRVDSRWAVLDAGGAAIASGASPTAGGQAAVGPLADGTYLFRVAQRNVAGAEGPAAERRFAVDTTAPAPPVPVAGGRRGPRASVPVFSWRPVEPGAVSTWRIRGARGVVVAGPLDTSAVAVAPPPLPAGAYVFEVRQVDPAGNVGPWGSEPFSVLPARSGTRLLRRNPGRLLPVAGVRVITRRPVLRWPRGPRGTRFYNVQVFRVAPRGRLVKVHSAFPTRGRLMVPRRARLRPGACYVWRVWPHRRGRYADAPIGVSDFCVTRPAARPRVR